MYGMSQDSPSGTLKGAIRYKHSGLTTEKEITMTGVGVSYIKAVWNQPLRFTALAPFMDEAF